MQVRDDVVSRIFDEAPCLTLDLRRVISVCHVGSRPDLDVAVSTGRYREVVRSRCDEPIALGISRKVRLRV
jgi:hypothetical protein